MTKISNKYTYLQFAEDVKALCKGEIEITADLRSKVIGKADDLIAVQLAKKDYNEKHPKKEGTAKGASEETMAKANLIKTVLNSEPITTAEINKMLGTDFSALQVANAIKYIDGAKSSKVIRQVVTSKGLNQEKEYTGYSIG